MASSQLRPVLPRTFRGFISVYKFHVGVIGVIYDDIICFMLFTAHGLLQVLYMCDIEVHKFYMFFV